VVELVPDGLREADVQHPVAVQVADLAAPDLEAELAPLVVPGGPAGPARHLGRDPLARGHARRRHGPSVRGPGRAFHRQSDLGPRRDDEGPPGAGPSRASASRSRSYLMKRTSEYFGSGHRSSGTTFSSLSATARTPFIASITALWTYLASSSTSPLSGCSRLAASRAKIASTNSSTSVLASSFRRVTPP